MKSSFGIHKIFAILLLSASVVFNSACNLSKYIPAKKYLLNDIQIKGAPAGEKEQLTNLIKQKPNKKYLFFFKFNMWSYLWLNSAKVQQHRRLKIEKLKAELAETKAELDKTDPKDEKNRNKTESKIIKIEKRIEHFENRVENLKKSIYEEPVLLDSTLLNTSASQLKSYLFVKGYFYDSVSYKIKTSGKLAYVTYSIIPGPAFSIRRLEYYIYDKRISDIVSRDTVNRLIEPGQQYNEDKIDQERNRIAALLREKGYYNFRRDFIYFEIDSALTGNFVDVGLGIANPGKFTRHRIYKIGNVYVEPEYTLNDTVVKDTTTYGKLKFISKTFRIKPSILSDFIFFRPGDLYKGSEYQNTMNRLSQLNSFQFIDIQFEADTTNKRDTALINVYMRLTPLKKQSIGYGFEFNSMEESEYQITTTRSLGAQADYTYRSRNIGQSALQLEIKPKGSIELPISILRKGALVDTPSYQYGFTSSLLLPQLLIPSRWLSEVAKRRNAQTSFNLEYIVESSKYFKRNTGTVNMSYQENLTNNIRLYITPIELSLVNTGYINDTFRAQVLRTHNPLLINLFDQHMITDFRVALLFNQPPLTNVKSMYWYLRLSGETGGNVPALLAIGRSKDPGAVTNKVFGINYYQYSKFEADFRFYIPVLKENNFAFRAIAGLGTPNSLTGLAWPATRSSILPFEKQFYVGGANSIRAWRLRTLGPGSYTDNSKTLNYDKSGDIKLEANAELRLPVYSLFKIALFADAGNVWLYNDDANRPGSGFYFRSFYKEIAIGGGIGFRLDFNYFVIRLDFAVPFKDPSLPDGQRWEMNRIFSDPDFIQNKMQINLGIGYPF